MNRLSQLIETGDYHIVVVGLPLRSDGGEGDMARRIRRVGEVLQTRTGVRIEYEDEWGTSLEAARRGLSDDQRDAVAAAAILQSYLDRTG